MSLVKVHERNKYDGGDGHGDDDGDVDGEDDGDEGNFRVWIMANRGHCATEWKVQAINNPACPHLWGAPGEGKEWPKGAERRDRGKRPLRAMASGGLSAATHATRAPTRFPALLPLVGVCRRSP